MIKFLIFCFLAFLVYRVFVKPLFVQSQPSFFERQQQNPMSAVQDALRQMMEQQQQRTASNGRSTPRQQSNHDDEYIDYEEVK